MARILLGSNAGPDYARLAEGDAIVIVTMRDGEGATMQVGYDDLDALNEMVILWTEARTKLATALIDKYGRERTVLSVQPGDRIVLTDDASTVGPVRGPLVEVSAVFVRATSVLCQVEGEGGVACSVTFGKDAMVVVVRQPAVEAVGDENRRARSGASALAELSRDVLR